FYQDYSYWSNQLLTSEYEGLYSEFDTEFYNVNWTHNKPSAFNGLTAYSCRNFIIDKCTTHNVSMYGTLYKKVTISHSMIGNIRVNSHNVEINSSIFDGALFPNTGFVFRFSGAGKTIISKALIRNYNPSVTDLFEYFYNTSHYNSVTIKNSSFCKLRYWSEKLIYPNLDYTTLFIEESNFDGFSKKLS